VVGFIARGFHEVKDLLVNSDEVFGLKFAGEPRRWASPFVEDFPGAAAAFVRIATLGRACVVATHERLPFRDFDEAGDACHAGWESGFHTRTCGRSSSLSGSRTPLKRVRVNNLLLSALKTSMVR